jgi:hypothetical protein
MRTEPVPAEAEHPLADLEGRDATADRLDLSRELVPEDRHPWPEKPVEEAIDEGLGRPHAAVGPVHRGRVNLDEHLVVLGRRLVHLCDPNHVRRTVSGVHCCLHGWTVATPPRSTATLARANPIPSRSANASAGRK